MTSDYGDAVAAALHAEAEQARDEMRAAGIACPSCGVNMADLPGGHQLAMESMPTGQVQCADGRRVLIASVDMFRAAANVGLYEEMRNNISRSGPQRPHVRRHGAKRDDRVPGRAG